MKNKIVKIRNKYLFEFKHAIDLTKYNLSVIKGFSIYDDDIFFSTIDQKSNKLVNTGKLLSFSLKNKNIFFRAEILNNLSTYGWLPFVFDINEQIIYFSESTEDDRNIVKKYNISQRKEEEFVKGHLNSKGNSVSITLIGECVAIRDMFSNVINIYNKSGELLTQLIGFDYDCELPIACTKLGQNKLLVSYYKKEENIISLNNFLKLKKRNDKNLLIWDILTNECHFLSNTDITFLYNPYLDQNGFLWYCHPHTSILYKMQIREHRLEVVFQCNLYTFFAEKTGRNDCRSIRICVYKDTLYSLNFSGEKPFLLLHKIIV